MDENKTRNSIEREIKKREIEEGKQIIIEILKRTLILLLVLLLPVLLLLPLPIQ